MKLIRPKTPDLERGSTRPVGDFIEFEILLRMKLMEEAAEMAASTSDEELLSEGGDLFETLVTLLHLRGFTLDQVIPRMEEKAERKGKLIDGIVLTHDPLSNKTKATI